MADKEGTLIDPIDGVRAGDFTLRIVPATGTDGHLDLPESRERAERALEDEEAAKQAGTVAPEPPLDLEHLAQAGSQASPGPPTPVIPLGEGGDVDASIEEARARAANEAPIPIVLRDPLTGKVVGSP